MALISCRQCGARWPVGEHGGVMSGGGCPTCGGSPLCDRCGHPRRDHVRVYVQGGTRECRRRIGDFQTLTSTACACAGYIPVEGSLADAGFAQADPVIEEGMPMAPLRVVKRR